MSGISQAEGPVMFQEWEPSEGALGLRSTWVNSGLEGVASVGSLSFCKLVQGDSCCSSVVCLRV